MTTPGFPVPEARIVGDLLDVGLSPNLPFRVESHVFAKVAKSLKASESKLS